VARLVDLVGNRDETCPLRQLSDVPPMSYQPVWLMLLLLPSGGKDRYTSAPVAELAWNAMSGTPRATAGSACCPPEAGRPGSSAGRTRG
jgi:hypothetical protein